MRSRGEHVSLQTSLARQIKLVAAACPRHRVSSTFCVPYPLQSQTVVFGQAELQCSLGPYVAVCLLDAALSLFLMYGGAVLYSSWRLLAVVEKEEAAKAAARPKSEQITAQQKRAMFNNGDDDDSSSSARPSFQ